VEENPFLVWKEIDNVDLNYVMLRPYTLLPYKLIFRKKKLPFRNGELQNIPLLAVSITNQTNLKKKLKRRCY